MGNRTQKTDSVTGTETYTTDAANRLLSVSSSNPNTGVYTNDANGNTLTGGGKVNTWDSQNRLVKVVKGGITSEFTYGCDGLRRRSVVTNAANETTQTDYVYDATMMVSEVVKHYNGSQVQVGSTDNVTYLQGPSGPLYRKSSLQADPKWYVYDGLGSVVGEVDVLGNLSATKSHDVYGLTRNVTGNPTSRQGFVGGLGHVSDDETGLVYMRARYYDPSVGRFASEDPALHGGGNWFAYCGNDPVNNIDQTGKWIIPIACLVLVICAAVAVAIGQYYDFDRGDWNDVAKSMQAIGKIEAAIATGTGAGNKSPNPDFRPGSNSAFGDRNAGVASFALGLAIGAVIAILIGYFLEQMTGE